MGKKEKKQIYQEPSPETINVGSSLGKSPLPFPQSQNFNSGGTQGSSDLQWDERFFNPLCLVSGSDGGDAAG